MWGGAAECRALSCLSCLLKGCVAEGGARGLPMNPPWNTVNQTQFWWLLGKQGYFRLKIWLISFSSDPDYQNLIKWYTAYSLPPFTYAFLNFWRILPWFLNLNICTFKKHGILFSPILTKRKDSYVLLNNRYTLWEDTIIPRFHHANITVGTPRLDGAEANWAPWPARVMWRWMACAPFCMLFQIFLFTSTNRSLHLFFCLHRILLPIHLYKLFTHCFLVTI